MSGDNPIPVHRIDGHGLARRAHGPCLDDRASVCDEPVVDCGVAGSAAPIPLQCLELIEYRLWRWLDCDYDGTESE